MKAKKLPSGNYRVQVLAGHDENGKRIMKSFTAEKEWEALKMADDYLESINKGVDISQDLTYAMTVDDAIANYIQSRSNILSPTTLHGYEMIHKSRLQNIRDIRIKELTLADIQAAVNYDSLRLSKKSIKDSLSLLKSSLSLQGIEMSFRRIALPQERPKRKDIPNVEDVIRVIIGTELELPCLLAMWLSLRMSEVRGLQFRDISPDGKWITIQRARLTINNRNVLREQNKTKESTRTNALPVYLKELIDKVPHDSEDDFIVKQRYTYLRIHFKKLMQANGFDITFHQLRHEFATTLNDLGIPSDYIQKLGGWSTDNVMKKVYTHTTAKKEREYQEKIDDFFNSAIKRNGNE